MSPKLVAEARGAADAVALRLRHHDSALHQGAAPLDVEARAVLDALDHRLLNETPPFDRINPSSENLARHIWQGMQAHLAAHDDPQAQLVRLHSVTVSEKGAQSATYLETD